MIIILILFSVGISSATIEFKNSTHTLTFEINDTVFTDNKHIYIDCKPHTIYKDGYVFFNFSFKKYIGNVDIYLGFTDSSYPINISILNGKEYIQVRNKIEKQRHELDDKEYWHYITNVKIIKNNSVRVWINVKEGVENGKYDFAVMKTGTRFTEAEPDNNLFILDPYYNSWYNPLCPCRGNDPCNNIKFIDLGNKKFLYFQSSYLCGDVTGSKDVSISDYVRIFEYILFGSPLNCLQPVINYEIIDYSHYIGTNIIRPNKSDKDV
jgi:hypothetical protein